MGHSDRKYRSATTPFVNLILSYISCCIQVPFRPNKRKHNKHTDIMLQYQIFSWQTQYRSLRSTSVFFVVSFTTRAKWFLGVTSQNQIVLVLLVTDDYLVHLVKTTVPFWVPSQSNTAFNISLLLKVFSKKILAFYMTLKFCHFNNHLFREVKFQHQKLELSIFFKVDLKFEPLKNISVFFANFSVNVLTTVSFLGDWGKATKLLPTSSDCKSFK